MGYSDYQSKIKFLEKQINNLQNELIRLKKKPRGRIGYILLAIGLFLFFIAFIYSHIISSFIGIALILWGVIILQIRPTQFIRKNIFDLTIIDINKYLRNIIEELDYDGEINYVSPVTLHGIRDVIIYVTKSESFNKPTYEQLANEDIFLKNPLAIKLIPPGLGLSKLIEHELQTDFSIIDIEHIQNSLEKALIDSLEIAKEIEMVTSKSQVNVIINGYVFYDIIEELEKTDIERYIGDPLISAIACIIAKSTRKIIVIENIKKEKTKNNVNVTYKLKDFEP